MKSFQALTRAARAIAAAAVGTTLVVAVHPAAAQTAWKPASTIRFIVPWPPGGATDVQARLLAPDLTERLGQPVIVENRPGAAGSIGATQVFEAKPDGLTLLIAVVDNSIYPQVKEGVRYDPTKFTPVAFLGSGPYILLGRSELPASTFQEFVALARKQQLTFANAGMGGSPHVVATAFGGEAKIDKMLHVPYQGMAPALQALLGNQTDALMVVTGGAIQYQGRLKLYAVAAKQRVPAVASVPTLTELGIPFVAEAWTGVVAPPGTPAPVVAALARAFNEATAVAAYRTKLGEIGMSMGSTPMSQPEFAKYYLDEYNKWGAVIRSANIKLD